MMKFLSAKWTNLLFANYVVEKDLLTDFAPRGTDVDSFAGEVYVSLVAFLFEDTKVLGIPGYFYRKFEEVNLRFYVVPEHDKTIRGVTFIKEIVPNRLIPLVANSLFMENYHCQPMTHVFEDGHVRYAWGEKDCSHFSVTAGTELQLPQQGSLAEFITEHYWGYAGNNRKTFEYQVTHPQWACCEVDEFQVQVDFGQLYGKRFESLSTTRPRNVLFARGSDVTVSFPRRV